MAVKGYSFKSGKRRGYDVVRIVIAGDEGTGKSCLIHSAAGYKVGTRVTWSPLLPPYCNGVPVTLIDTTGFMEKEDIDKKLKQADSVILTYACDRPQTLLNLTTVWFPRLRRLKIKVPVIVVGCKIDLLDENQQVSLQQLVSSLMQQFHSHEVEAHIECSAYSRPQVFDVFFLAQKAVFYPTAPLFDKRSQTLKPQCGWALKRIFILCDRDRDGALSDAELNDFQVKCFNAPLQPHEIMDLKKVVQTNLSEGVNEQGLTLTGFLHLHALFIEKGPIETTWTVLRKFGYNDDIKLDDYFIPPVKCAPDQSVELTSQAIDFLVTIFNEFDGDLILDKVLQPRELKELVSTSPESLWMENPYKDAVERNAFGGLSLYAFLSEWALMTLLNPTFTVENLKYMGYPGHPSSAIRVTRRRHVDRKKQRSERNVLQCFIFGPMKAGKSALLNYFIGRPYSEACSPTNEDRHAVNVVDISTGKKIYLVLREISEDGVTELLANKESLASCDIAVFVHDRSDESSWKASSELLLKIAVHGEVTGFQVPCLTVAAKGDQGSFTMAIQEATMVSQDMRVEALVPISVNLGDINNIFHRIVTAAEHPHLSIPKTEAGKIRRLIDQSLMFASVGLGAAVAIGVGAARKNASR